MQFCTLGIITGQLQPFKVEWIPPSGSRYCAKKNKSKTRTHDPHLVLASSLRLDPDTNDPGTEGALLGDPDYPSRE